MFACVGRHQARVHRWLKLQPANRRKAHVDHVEDAVSRRRDCRADRRRLHQQQARRG
jgi:hypothetical protein